MTICRVCNFELYLDQHDNVLCPNCNDFNPLSKSKSLEICEKLIKSFENKIDLICNEFSYDYLLKFGCEFREFGTKQESKNATEFRIDQIIEGTIFIKKVLASLHGKRKYSKQPKNLKSNLLDLASLRQYIVFIHEDYGNLFECSNDLIKKFGFKCILSENNKNYTFIPKISYLDYKNNLKEYYMYPDTKFKELNEIANDENNQLKDYENSEKILFEVLRGIYYSLNYISLDPEMFSFDEIDNNPIVLKFIKDLYFVSEEIVLMTGKPFAIMSKNLFFKMSNDYNFDSEKLYKMLVSSRSDIKNYPLLIEHDNKIILSPNVILLVWSFLEYKFNPEKVNNILTGHYFEDKIEKKLLKLGFTTEDPNNPKLFLKGRKVKNKKFKREIDLIAYNDSTILVIECKDQGLWKIDPKILWKKRKEYRIKDIKEEIDNKHLDRVQFVKDNYKNHFGFKKDYKIEGLLLTSIKEDIDGYKGVKILCVYELKKIIEF